MVSIGGQQLSANHLAELKASAISDEVIATRGYRSITNPKALPRMFTGNQRERSGLLMPIHDVTGSIATYQYKPNEPRIAADGRPIKYETATGGRPCIDVPLSVLPYLRNPDADLWITEGCKKVDSALSHGIPCIVGLTGVWNWCSGKTALPDWREITLHDRKVIIAFDSDVMRKDSPRKAIEELGAFLQMRQARVHYLLMPDLANVEAAQ